MSELTDFVYESDVKNDVNKSLRLGLYAEAESIVELRKRLDVLIMVLKSDNKEYYKLLEEANNRLFDFVDYLKSDASALRYK